MSGVKKSRKINAKILLLHICIEIKTKDCIEKNLPHLILSYCIQLIHFCFAKKPWPSISTNQRNSSNELLNQYLLIFSCEVHVFRGKIELDHGYRYYLLTWIRKLVCSIPNHEIHSWLGLLWPKVNAMNKSWWSCPFFARSVDTVFGGKVYLFTFCRMCQLRRDLSDFPKYRPKVKRARKNPFEHTVFIW